MPAVAERIAEVETEERETLDTTPIITTLYDLIAALNEEVKPWEEDGVTAAVVDLCNSGRLKFLNAPKAYEVACA